MINELFIILQHVPPLCDYKVWIDVVRGPEVISYLCLMVRLNMMEEEFRVCRMEEHKCTTYFAMHRETNHERDKEKREEERAHKCEKHTMQRKLLLEVVNKRS
jgi:hypothetical protein